jgi:hypothetical protein
MPDTKPTFFQSMMSGIKGWTKGLFAGGAVGAATGLIVGAIIGLLPGVALATAAAYGLGYGTLLFASVGATSGAVTEVVRSREAHQVSGQDVTNVAKIAFAQGVSVGQQVTLAQADEAHKEANFRKMVEERRAAVEATKQRT